MNGILWFWNIGSYMIMFVVAMARAIVGEWNWVAMILSYLGMSI